jgi:hypothetical protein
MGELDILQPRLAARLEARAAQLLPSFPAEDLGLLVWALGQARWRPQGGLMGAWLREAGGRVGGMSPRAASLMLLAMSQQLVRPSRAWLRAWCGATAAQMRAGGARAAGERGSAGASAGSRSASGSRRAASSTTATGRSRRGGGASSSDSASTAPASSASSSSSSVWGPRELSSAVYALGRFRAPDRKLAAPRVEPDQAWLVSGGGGRGR